MAAIGKPTISGGALPRTAFGGAPKAAFTGVRDLGGYIREQRRSAQISVRQLASLTGVSNPYLSQIERGLRHPSAEILQQIAKGLRISAEALYVQAGILDERHVANDTTSAIHADTEISERQKQVLLEVYASFRSTEDHDTGPPESTQPESAQPDRGSAPATTQETR